MGEGNYAHGGRVVFLPLMGWGCCSIAVCYGESSTKEIKGIHPQKRGSQMRLNFSCMGFVRTDLSCRWKKRGAICKIIQKRGSQM
jgi:hypothetical protein